MFWTVETAEHIWKRHGLRIEEVARALEDPYCLIEETQYEGRLQERVVGIADGKLIIVITGEEWLGTAWHSSREETRKYLKRLSKKLRLWGKTEIIAGRDEPACCG